MVWRAGPLLVSAVMNAGAGGKEVLTALWQNVLPPINLSPRYVLSTLPQGGESFFTRHTRKVMGKATSTSRQSV